MKNTIKKAMAAIMATMMVAGAMSVTAVSAADIEETPTISVAEEKTYIPGDTNMDGKITVTDSIMVLKHISHIKELTEEQMKAGDINGDGKITLADSLGINRYIANAPKEEQKETPTEIELTTEVPTELSTELPTV